MLLKEKSDVEQANLQTDDRKPIANNFEAAVERIQRKYGNDLDAFFRDAKESILKRRTERRSIVTCD